MSTQKHTPFFHPCLLLAALLFACFAGALTASAAHNQIRAAAPEERNSAAETDSAKHMRERAIIKATATPIAVLHEGTDSLGARLGYQLKEIFNAGTLFALNDKDEPKLQMIISTTSEFPSRPGVGSLYCVVWTYSERPTALSSYLAQEVGIITPENLAELAATLAARTGGLAAKHSYIFDN